MSRDVKALAVLIPYAVLVHPFNQFPADGEIAVRTGNAMGCSHHPCSRPALHSLPWSMVKRPLFDRGVQSVGKYSQGERVGSGSRSGSSGSHGLKVRLAATPMPARCFPIPPFSDPRVCSLRGPEQGCGCGCETIPPSRHNRRGRLGTTVPNPEPHQ